MSRLSESLSMLLILIMATSAIGQMNPNKKTLIASLDRKYEELTQLSDKIWSYEEIAFREHKSADALATYAENLSLIHI